MNIFKKVYSLLTSDERRSALVLFVLMLIGMVLETFGIGLVIPVVGLLANQNFAEKLPLFQKILNWFNHPSQSEIVIGAMLVLVCIYAVKNLFLAYLAWRQSTFAHGVQQQISQRLFNIYLGQPYTFHLQKNTAQLINNVTTETNMLTQSISSFLLVMTEGFVVLGVATLLIFAQPLGAVLVVSVVVVSAYVFLKATRASILRWGQSRHYHEGMRIQHLQQGLGGIKDVLILGRSDNFQKQFKIHNDISAKVSGKQNALQQIPKLWLEFLAVCGLATLVIIMLKQGRDINAILPTLGLFAAAAFRLIPSVNRILSSIQSVRYGIPVVETLSRELILPTHFSSGVDDYEKKDIMIFSNEIKLDSVKFHYSSAPSAAISNVTLNVRKGELVAFIGTSGSGKSTLVDLIMGLLAPQGGEILVDGQRISSNLVSWQRNIGYVAQSIYLADGTIEENVAFGIPKESIDKDAVRSAIRAAQLEDFISSLPLGIATVVGERGVRLSGGQRQRIGIARALYHDPDVLVLDEATSALDNETESDVMSAINALHGTKTIIIVAHRLTTISNCDRVYRLSNGCMVEEILRPDLHLIVQNN